MKTLITFTSVLLLSGLFLISSPDETMSFSPSISYNLFPTTAKVLAAEKEKAAQDLLKTQKKEEQAEMLKLSRLVELFLRIPR